MLSPLPSLRSPAPTTKPRLRSRLRRAFAIASRARRPWSVPFALGLTLTPLLLIADAGADETRPIPLTRYALELGPDRVSTAPTSAIPNRWDRTPLFRLQARPTVAPRALSPRPRPAPVTREITARAIQQVVAAESSRLRSGALGVGRGRVQSARPEPSPLLAAFPGEDPLRHDAIAAVYGPQQPLRCADAPHVAALATDPNVNRVFPIPAAPHAGPLGESRPLDLGETAAASDQSC